MQLLPRICPLLNHHSRNISLVCAYKQCNTSRFICLACMFDGIHRHDLLDCNHILDQQGFCDMMKNSLLVSQDQQAKDQLNLDLLKQILQQIQNRLTNINNIIQTIEQSKLQNDYSKYLEEQLQNIQNFGFNLLDSQQLDKLLNIKQLQYQQFSDIKQKLKNDILFFMQDVQKLNEWQLLSIDHNHIQQIKNADYKIKQVDKLELFRNQILSGTISYDQKYIASGQSDNRLNIWNFENYELIIYKYISNKVTSCKFTEDSTILYAGTTGNLYQFDVNNNFENISCYKLECDSIVQILCISNTIILISSTDNHIIKTDFNKKQQIFKIKAFYNYFGCFDYNKKSNMIASGSNDGIKIWDGSFGELKIHQQKAYINKVRQIVFIIQNDQLVSLDYSYIIFWNINYQSQQLEQLQLIQTSGIKISLVLDQKYILVIGQKFIKIYSITINGYYIRQLNHSIDQYKDFDSISLESMKAILIYQGTVMEICKIEME